MKDVQLSSAVVRSSVSLIERILGDSLSIRYISTCGSEWCCASDAIQLHSPSTRQLGNCGSTGVEIVVSSMEPNSIRLQLVIISYRQLRINRIRNSGILDGT